MSHSVLTKWVALKHGDGIVRAKKVSYYLSLITLALCFPVVFGCINGQVPAWLLVALSIAIGWLIAERNALDDRARLWPTISNYIDWSKVERDLQSSNSNA